MRKKTFGKALSLILTLAMLLSFSAVPMMASAASTPINPTELLNENFDEEGVVAGDNLIGEGKWRFSSDTANNLSAVAASKDGSNVLKLAKTADTTMNLIRKDFEDTFTDGIVSVKYRFNIESIQSGKGLQIFLYGNKASGSGEGSILLNYRCSSSYTYFQGESADMAKRWQTIPQNGTWYDFEMVYNTENKQMALYYGDSVAIPFIDRSSSNTALTLGDTVTGMGLYITRDGSAATVYFDDILVQGYKQAEFDAEKLSFPASYENGKFALPQVGASGSTVTWKSSDTSVISDNGDVASVSETKSVIMTATVTDTQGNSFIKEFPVKIYSDNTYFYEDFEAPEFTEFPWAYGQTLEGWNGWLLNTGTNSGSRVKDTDWTVAAESDSVSNLVLKNKRTGTPSSNGSVAHPLSKALLKSAAEEELLKISFKLKRPSKDNGKMQFNFIGENGTSEYFALYENTIDLRSTNAYRFTMNETVADGEWHDFEVVFNQRDKEISIYEDGYPVVENQDYTGDGNGNYADAINTIQIQSNRTAGGTNGEFWIDDIIVTGTSFAEEEISKISIATETGGEDIELPTAGKFGTLVTWRSSDTTVISDKGEVTPSSVTRVVTMTAAVGQLSKEFKVKVLGENILLDENFDAPYAAPGTAIDGYNGWIAEENADYVPDTTATIEAYEGSNALSILRGNQASIDKNKCASFGMRKAYAKSTAGSVIETSFKVYTDLAAKRFQVRVAGMWFDINPANKRAKVYTSDNTAGSGFITNDAINYTGLNEVVISVNLREKTASLRINGAVVFSDYFLSGCTGDESEFYIQSDRTGNGAGAQFYVDDIKVRIPYDLNVVGVDFKDADGNIAAGKTDGGSISSVTIAANEKKVSAAKIIAAVYEGEKLYSANIGTLSESISPLSAKMVTVSVPLPEKNAAEATIRVFALDSMSNLKPVSMPFTYDRAAEDKITLWLCGDSMTRTYSATETSEDNISGLSNHIGNYFDSSAVEIHPLAVGGRSTKTFYESGSLQNNLANIKSGDYVFIMFGHNDKSADAEKHTEPYGDYQDYLKRFVLMARSRGAIPVLMTPITRCYFEYKDADGNVVQGFDFNAMGDYPQAMRDLAGELNVAIIDNTEYSQNWISKLTKETALPYYANDDTTHMSPEGMKIITEYVVKSIGELNLPLSIYTVK